MSYFAFKRDENNNVVVTDQILLESIEILINQLMLLNERFEEAHETGLYLEDIDGTVD